MEEVECKMQVVEDKQMVSKVAVSSLTTAAGGCQYLKGSTTVYETRERMRWTPVSSRRQTDDPARSLGKESRELGLQSGHCGALARHKLMEGEDGWLPVVSLTWCWRCIKQVD